MAEGLWKQNKNQTKLKVPEERQALRLEKDTEVLFPEFLRILVNAAQCLANNKCLTNTFPFTFPWSGSYWDPNKWVHEAEYTSVESLKSTGLGNF